MIGYTPKPVPEFTEADWTDPDTPGLAPYPRSKAVAERAARDLMERDGGSTELLRTAVFKHPKMPRPTPSSQRLRVHRTGQSVCRHEKSRQRSGAARNRRALCRVRNIPVRSAAVVMGTQAQG